MKKILLTGATGVVGSFILKELCSIQEIELHCLIRGENPEKRLSDVLLFLKTERPSFVHVIAGDITKSNLGIKDSDYKNCLQNLTHIIHCASNVDLTMPLDEAYQHTVFPTEEIVKILSQVPNCKLDYVSTVGVNGKRKNPLGEERILEQREFFNTYEQGKAKAENLLYEALDQKKKITIHRPSMVVGDSENGKIIQYQIFYHIVRLLAGFYNHGLQADINRFKLDTVPVDFVAKTIVASMQNENSVGKILNICAGAQHSLSLGEIQTMSRKSFEKYQVKLPKLKIIPLSIFRTALLLLKLMIDQNSKKRVTILQQLLDYAEDSQPFENTKSLKLYHDWGINLPKPINFLSNCLDRYAESYANRKN